MPLQYKVGMIPAINAEQNETEFNRFLRSVRVVKIHREFVSDGGNSFWSFAVEYLASDEKGESDPKKKGKVDYRELLSPEEFAIYAKLRDWRKASAEKESVPVYTIFTNDQLAAISRKRIRTKTGLSEIEGIGDARIGKYGEAVIRIVEEEIKADRQKAE